MQLCRDKDDMSKITLVEGAYLHCSAKRVECDAEDDVVVADADDNEDDDINVKTEMTVDDEIDGDLVENERISQHRKSGCSIGCNRLFQL